MSTKKVLNPIEKLQAAAAAKWNTQTSTSVSVTPLEALRNDTKLLVASINKAAALQYLATLEITENVDIEKTAAVLVRAAKSTLATKAKEQEELLEQGATGHPLPSLEQLFVESFKEWEALPIPELYKGLIVAVDVNNLPPSNQKNTAGAAEKFAQIGVNADVPFGLLTRLSYDKSANNIFAQISGVDTSAGTVRVAMKYIAPADGVNSEDSLANFNEKVEELMSLIREVKPVYSKAALKKVVEQLNLSLSDDIIYEAFGDVDAEHFRGMIRQALKIAIQA